jgi:hypothetical protein
MLPSKICHDNQIPYEGDQKKKGRRFFNGTNRSGFNLEMHETILGPGTETHAPQEHLHEEILIVIEGTVEAYLEGKTETAEAGSVIDETSKWLVSYICRRFPGLDLLVPGILADHPPHLVA